MMCKQVNFEELLAQVKHPLVGKESLSIWGGTCSESALLDFIKGWPLERMPYRIWEYVSDIVFEKNSLPGTAVLLQRGRLFGEDGDLELRRDGDLFRWRFVGRAGVSPPKGCKAKNFWDSHRGMAFHRYTETALLWGTRQDAKRHTREGEWYDDRVGKAHLQYPEDGDRLQLGYKTYSHAGRVQFVWLTDLSKWKEVQGG